MNSVTKTNLLPISFVDKYLICIPGSCKRFHPSPDGRVPVFSHEQQGKIPYIRIVKQQRLSRTAIRLADPQFRQNLSLFADGRLLHYLQRIHIDHANPWKTVIMVLL